MAMRKPHRADSLERAIENALQPGRFISYGASHGFVSDLEEAANGIENVVRTDAWVGTPGRGAKPQAQCASVNHAAP